MHRKAYAIFFTIFAQVVCFVIIFTSSEYFGYVKFQIRDFNGFIRSEIQKFIFFRNCENNLLDNQSKFDVLRNDLELKILPERNYLIGKVKSLIKVNSELPQIKLNLDNNLEVLHVSSSLSVKKYSHSNDVLSIEFINPPEEFDTLSLEISYKGSPPRIGLGSFTFVHDEKGSRFYTLSEPYFARTWFPCKDTPSDKFLASVKLVVPKNIFALSNGKLIDITYLDSNFVLYRYETTYPIATYLVSVLGAEYENFQDEFKSISGKNIPLRYFVFKGNKENAKKDFSVIPKIMGCFEKFFGEYPFQNEQYGIVEFDWPYGGMEHQTLTSISSNFITGFRLSDNLHSHELAHQWFGNSVTIKSWGNIWLNEGFASYSEFLFNQCLSSNQNISFNEYVGEIYYGRIHNPNGFLFDRTIYKKGAWILHMLRGQVGDDQFFKILKEYYQKFKFSNVTIYDFIEICEEISKQDLKKFFDQWLFSRIEKPYYRIQYRTFIKDKNYICSVKIVQAQPERIFIMKIPIEIDYENGEKYQTIIFNDAREQIVNFKVDGEVKNLKFDPQNWILKDVQYFSDSNR